MKSCCTTINKYPALLPATEEKSFSFSAMAALSLRLFLALLLLAMFRAGWCQCDLSNIKVTQNVTGVYIHGKLEYQVLVTNDCICSQVRVRFRADGFQTLEPVDPTVFRSDGKAYLLNDGQPIYGFETVIFKYAWDNQFQIIPIQSQIACS